MPTPYMHDIADGTSNTMMIGERMPAPAEGHECVVFLLGGIPNLSPGGAVQLVKGHVISDPKDRRILGDAMLKDLGFSALTGETSIGMLLPAIQAARQAAGSNQGWGPWEVNPGRILSVAGALQFFSGDPVFDPRDRSNIFAVWLTVGYLTEPTRSSYTWAYHVRRPRN